MWGKWFAFIVCFSRLSLLGVNIMKKIIILDPDVFNQPMPCLPLPSTRVTILTLHSVCVHSVCDADVHSNIIGQIGENATAVNV